MNSERSHAAASPPARWRAQNSFLWATGTAVVEVSEVELISLVEVAPQ